MTPLPIMLAIWTMCTTVFIALVIYRGHLTRHEIDQVFLNDAVEHNREIEHDNIVRRVIQVDPFLKTVGGAAALLTLGIIGVYIAQVLPTARF